MGCESCHNSPPPVSAWTHEADMARMERTNRRLWVMCIVLVVSLIASWAGFLVYESQFETVTETTTQEVSQIADDNSTIKFVGGDSYARYADR